MTEVEKAWAAGFFDGEGCIMFNPSVGKRGKPRLRLSVAQNDREPLFWLRSHWGGCVEQEPGRRCSRWTVEGRKALQFLADTAPYRRVKGA